MEVLPVTAELAGLDVSDHVSVGDDDVARHIDAATGRVRSARSCSRRSRSWSLRRTSCAAAPTSSRCCARKSSRSSRSTVAARWRGWADPRFVVLVLQRFFSMGIEDATRVMLQVHQQGVAVCGVFTYEVAETKVTQVIDFARENQHPLQCTLEKA